MNGTPAFKKVAFYGVVVIALIVIVKYVFYLATETKLEDAKQDAGDYIIIPGDYTTTQKDYFSNWQKA